MEVVIDDLGYKGTGFLDFFGNLRPAGKKQNTHTWNKKSGPDVDKFCLLKFGQFYMIF